MNKTEKENQRLYKKLLFFHSIANFFFNRFRFFGSRKLARFINKLFLPPLHKDTICPTIYGFDIFLNNEKNSEIHEIYNLGFYEHGTLSVMSKCLRQGDVFIDVGASIGLMSLFASPIVDESGKVFAFEPTTKSYDTFSTSIKINNLKNVALHKIGLGNQKQSIQIYTNRACPSMVSLNKEEPYEIVEIERLDDFLAKEKISGIRMIKIDVEGFELEVLKGAKEILSGENAPIICIEYMKSLIRNNELNFIHYLKQLNNYEFFQLESGKNIASKLIRVKQEKEFINDDNLFCFLKKHIDSLSVNIFKN